MKSNKGIITILVGIGVLFISIFFSSPSKYYSYNRNFIGNISSMEIVLVGERAGTSEELIEKTRQRARGGSYERFAIPLKYPLSFSVVLILVGTGIVLISKNK